MDPRGSILDRERERIGVEAALQALESARNRNAAAQLQAQKCFELFGMARHFFRGRPQRYLAAPVGAVNNTVWRRQDDADGPSCTS